MSFIALGILTSANYIQVIIEEDVFLCYDTLCFPLSFGVEWGTMPPALQHCGSGTWGLNLGLLCQAPAALQCWFSVANPDGRLWQWCLVQCLAQSASS